jgi:nitrate reductase NapD
MTYNEPHEASDITNHSSKNSSANNNDHPLAIVQDNTEYHVASFIALVMKSQIDAIIRQIKAIDGAEIHGISAEGKIVFTVEASDQKHITRQVEPLKDQKGLLTLAPVYHQFIPASDNIQ